MNRREAAVVEGIVPQRVRALAAPPVPDAETAMAQSRMLPGFLFVLLLTALGFIAGAFIGASFLVRPDDGLAAGATVLVSGLFGGGVTLVIAVWLVRAMPREQLWRGVVVALAGVLLAALLIYQRSRRVREAREQRTEHVRDRTLDRHAAPPASAAGAPYIAIHRRSSAHPRAA